MQKINVWNGQNKVNLLVTGGTGFIGKNVVEALYQSHNICCLVRNSSDIKEIETLDIKIVRYNNYTNIEQLFKANKFDGIIHFASNVIVKHQTSSINNLLRSNIEFPTHIIEAAVNSNVKWFLNTGTFWQHYEDNHYSPVNLYAATKQAFEDVAKYYYETNDINFVTIKLNDTFGANDSRGKIFNLWKNILNSGESLDMSSGEQIIDMIYIDDVVDAYIKLINLIQKDEKCLLCGKSFSINSSERMTLRQLAALFESTTGEILNINWGKRAHRSREVMIPWSKGISIPGWEQTISLAEGIKKVMGKK